MPTLPQEVEDLQSKVVDIDMEIGAMRERVLRIERLIVLLTKRAAPVWLRSEPSEALRQIAAEIEHEHGEDNGQ